MSVQYQPGDTYVGVVPVLSSVGAAVNADSPPAATVYRNGAADGAVTATVTNQSTGVYSVSFAVPGTYSAGDKVGVILTATIGGVVAVGVVGQFRLVGWSPTALPATGTLAVKPAVTLAQADFTGKVPATVAAGDGADSLSVKNTVGVAGAGLTSLGDARLANLDATVSSRSTFAGGAVAGVTTPVTVGMNNDKAGYQLDLTQAITDVKSATTGGAFAGAWAFGWGKVVKNVVTNVLGVWGPGNSTATPSATFALDNATNPTTRTPQ